MAAPGRSSAAGARNQTTAAAAITTAAARASHVPRARAGRGDTRGALSRPARTAASEPGGDGRGGGQLARRPPQSPERVELGLARLAGREVALELLALALREFTRDQVVDPLRPVCVAHHQLSEPEGYRGGASPLSAANRPRRALDRRERTVPTGHLSASAASE